MNIIINLIVSLSEKQKKIFALLSLSIIIICIYLPTFSNDFNLGWDDKWMIFNDYTELPILSAIKEILFNYYYGQYSPLNQFFYTIIYHIFGYNPFAFHTFSLLLHIGNSCLVYLIINTFSNRKISYVVALLFAIHPLQVESVAWISASKILVYSFFYLLAMRFYISFFRTLKPVYYAITLICFVLSFGGKEQAVTLPVTLILIDLIFKRKMNTSGIWLEKIPFFVLALFFAWVTFDSHGIFEGEKNSFGSHLYPFSQRLAFAAYAIVEYAIKLIIPVNLFYFYPFPILPGESLELRFWFYPLLLLVCLLAGWKFIKRKEILYSLLFFIIQLALTLHIIPMSRRSIVADRYIYLASIGLFYIIAYYLNYFLLKHKKTWLLLFFIYIIFLGGYTYHRCHTWKDSDTLKKEIRELNNIYPVTFYQKNSTIFLSSIYL